MKITLGGNIKPYKALTTKAIPQHWIPEAERVLNNFLEKGVIERVPLEEPSDWVSPAFFVPKDDSPTPRLRLVTDFSRLNKFVVRPVHPFPSAADIMRGIPADSTVFCKLDAVWGYHQMPLEEQSRKLTTFLLPSGRYRYKRGPMGCLLYTSPSPRDKRQSRMPSSA